MKILITGNMGYVGPGVVKHLRTVYPEATLIGFDIGYFAHCLTHAPMLPECNADIQYFGDVREFPREILKGVDAIVHLAAISNDPMGNKYEEVTLDINYRASINLARLAKDAGVKAFCFASSCSVYGCAEDGARKEDSILNPLTAYAKSKVFTEQDLKNLADDHFKATALRFSTACGMSDRLRLDLVLNDFVASAVATKKITILSDGTPWRPLINVKDMARAFEWAIDRDPAEGGNFLAVNIGTDSWNYQVKELAEGVAKVISGTQVSVNPDAQPDKRSYKVDFSLFRKLAPSHQPQFDLLRTVDELKDGLEGMEFNDPNFRDSQMMRLKVLGHLESHGLITPELTWTLQSKGVTVNS